MKKQLFMAAVCLGMATAAKAQSPIIFEQEFEGTWQDITNEGWKFHVANGTNSTYGIFNSNPSITNIGFSGNTLGAGTYEIVGTTPVFIPDVDVIITTPVIALPDEQDLVMSYRLGSLGMGGGGTSNYSVYIISAAEMAAVNNPAELAALLDGKMVEDSATIGGESSVTSFTMGGYAGESLVVAFRLHDSASSATLLLDDVIFRRGTLASDSYEEVNFSVYPNPAQDHIAINSTAQSLKAVTITDVNGRTVYNQQLNGGTDVLVDISGLGAGMYILNAASEKGTTTKKFIKQ